MFYRFRNYIYRYTHLHTDVKPYWMLLTLLTLTFKFLYFSK